MANAMRQIADDLVRDVTSFYHAHRELSDALTSINLAADAWSLKEIIGHLVDSAANNHQRFVHLQVSGELRFPEYFAEPWLRVQHHNSVAWETLITLWHGYNLFLANIIGTLKADCLRHEWVLEDKSITLERLATDYPRHLRDHLAHFEKRLDKLKAAGHGV